jgi:hypothetical protein
MSLATSPIICKIKGHIWMGGSTVDTYRRNETGTMEKEGYRVHLICFRCDKREVRHITRPRGQTDVSLHLEADRR